MTDPIAPPVNMVAASRVARRVNLLEVRLAQLDASRLEAAPGGELAPEFTQRHATIAHEACKIIVASFFDFTVKSLGVPVANVRATYHLVYELDGEEAVAEDDLVHFSSANGAYHSWPFVRELLHGMTGRMGFPPYTLPVMSFLPPQRGVKSDKHKHGEGEHAER